MLGMTRVLGLGVPLVLAVSAGLTATASARPAGTFCSVFSHRPCTPYFCGIHSGPNCRPEIFYPLNPDERRTLQFQNVDGPPQGPPTASINTLAEFYSAIEHCWRPPPLDVSRPGMEITVLITFTRTGAVLGKPLITYESPGASDEQRLAYRTAMADSLSHCTPLPFTDGFGNAQAGRPSRIRFIDTRQQKKAEFNG
jgi:hypothetical protein